MTITIAITIYNYTNNYNSNYLLSSGPRAGHWPHHDSSSINEDSSINGNSSITIKT